MSESDRARYVRFSISLRYGVINLRGRSHLYQLKAPWCRPLFSERYGYTPTLARFLGWRLIRKDIAAAYESP